MNILIVEDENLLAEELAEKLITIEPTVQIVAVLESVNDTLDWLSSNTCDLIFMDIHLSDGISFSIFDTIKVDCPVVFTTAYDQYAIQAFDVNSIAYLLKPIGDADLRKAIDKYKNLSALSFDSIRTLLETDKAKSKNKSMYKQRIILNSGNKQKPFYLNDIAYFMADNRYVFAVSKEGNKYFYDSVLYQLETEINPEQFFRLNRTFLVNFDSITEIIPFSKSRLKINLKPEPEQDVIVSAKRVADLKQWLNGE